MINIAAPNTDRTLLTTDELRSAAGVADGSKDTELRLLGGYVAATITRACKVVTDGAIPPTLRLESVGQTFRLKSRQEALILARVPVVDIFSVTERGVLLDVVDYEVESSSGLLYRLSGSCRSCWDCGTVVTEFSAGYAVVPDDLKYAAIRFVKIMLTQESGYDPMLKRESIPGVIDREWWVDPTKSPAIPTEVIELLQSGGYVNGPIV